MAMPLAGDAEHQHVAGHVADGRDLLEGDAQHARVEAHHHPLVGVGVRDVEVVGLRARRRHVRAHPLPQLGLGARHQRVIVADADDLHRPVEHAAQIADHRRRELHRVLLVRDVGRGRVADEPVGAAVHPDVEARREQVVRRPPPPRPAAAGTAATTVVRSGWTNIAAVERGDRRGEPERPDQHRHPARRPPAGDRQRDAGGAQPRHRLARARREPVVPGHQRAVDVGDEQPDPAHVPLPRSRGDRFDRLQPVSGRHQAIRRGGPPRARLVQVQRRPPVEDRIDDAPLLLDGVLAGEQAGVAAHRVPEQPLVGQHVVRLLLLRDQLHLAPDHRLAGTLDVHVRPPARSRRGRPESGSTGAPISPRRRCRAAAA